ncbi:hypothetical protein Y1Q_0016223 [Alligator mississippiensis]|uniref:Uncharacterized protein n=1 Tax=Alligator mississippiensis TaxID=8496 RepID=A0A151NKQ3_ALLMI|nr:hypothetical protein Y1Q_0016223 [Alligator mississippiensis]
MVVLKAAVLFHPRNAWRWWQGPGRCLGKAQMQQWTVLACKRSRRGGETESQREARANEISGWHKTWEAWPTWKRIGLSPGKNQRRKLGASQSVATA